jgi:hypothetical protein
MARWDFAADYDFIGFTYNGWHSIDDLKIYRVGDGDRYNMNLSPESKDSTAEVINGNGVYFFNSKHTQRVFNIPFAFDDLKEEDIRKLSEVFKGGE